MKTLLAHGVVQCDAVQSHYDCWMRSVTRHLDEQQIIERNGIVTEAIPGQTVARERPARRRREAAKSTEIGVSSKSSKRES